ncbi:MAG: hypothetical protein H6Q73_544 [Firmicutes bacterium]|nr:hypothetical protein [Bacillota bacterium]
MRNGFWHGLVWGGLIGTVFTAAMSPLMKPKKKPLVERSANAIKATTRDLMREARRTRKRIMKKL